MHQDHATYGVVAQFRACRLRAQISYAMRQITLRRRVANMHVSRFLCRLIWALQLCSARGGMGVTFMYGPIKSGYRVWRDECNYLNTTFHTVAVGMNSVSHPCP